METTPKLQRPSPSASYRCKRLSRVNCCGRFGKNALDVGNAAIQAARHCERTISLLNHLRVHHRDATAIIRMGVQLQQRRNELLYLKRHDALAYFQVLRLYGLKDVDCGNKGEGIHKQNFHCTMKKRSKGQRH